jgi:transcriptional regulator with XRE-family HTH domain
MDTSLGQRIAYFRKKANLRQTDLAAKLGITQTALSYYETDEREPTVNMLVKIAKTLEITGDTLLGLEHPERTAGNDMEFDLLLATRNLNNIGQKRALEYISGLAELPKYTVKLEKPA